MKDWLPRCPIYDSQYSAITHVDAQSCTAESFCHIFYMLTGIRVSPRALAVMAGLKDPNNRNVENILKTVNSLGLVPYDNCPTPDSFTMDSYYAPLQGIEKNAFPVQVKLIPVNLDISPIWTELEYGATLPIPTRHMVAQINNTQYFDSEIGSPIKLLTQTTTLGAGPPQIVWQSSLIITSPMNEAKVVLSKDNKTVYVAYPIATDWPNFQKQASVEGIVVPSPIPPSSSL